MLGKMKVVLSVRSALLSLFLFQLLLFSVDCQNITMEQTPSLETTATYGTSTTSNAILTTSFSSSSSSSSIITTTITTTTTTNAQSVISRIPTTTQVITTTTLSTLQPPSSAVSSAIVPSIVTTTTPFIASSSVRPLSSSTVASTTTASSAILNSSTTPPTPSSTRSSITSSATPAPSVSLNTNGENQKKSDTTPIIVGSVVGGIVGLALIGGALACINRRGGYTKKRRDRTKKPDFEDYGLGDFQQKSAPIMKPISPTIPRLNEQGNYYHDSYQHYGYPQEDYGVQNQHHGGYYYSQPQQQSEYYDDGGYYYDNSADGTPTAAYSSPPTGQSYNAQGYVVNTNMGYPPINQQQNTYKPDDTASPVSTIIDGHKK